MTGYWYGTKREVIDYMKRTILADQSNAVTGVYPCNEYRQVTGEYESVQEWYYQAFDEVEAEKK